MSASKNENDVKSGVPRKLRQLLNIRMLREGWTNVNEFRRGAGIPYSLETVRRAFNECDYKNLETSTLAVIMRHLNYPPKEIKAILAKHLNPNDPVLQLIGDKSETKLSIAEEKLVELYRTIMEDHPELSNSLADHLDLLGKVANVPTKVNTDALRRSM